MSLDTNATTGQENEEDVGIVLEQFKNLVDARKYAEARRLYNEQTGDMRQMIQNMALGYYKEMMGPFPRGV